MTKPVRVNITLPAEMYEKLRKQAFNAKTSPTALARKAVTWYLAAIMAVQK